VAVLGQENWSMVGLPLWHVDLTIMNDDDDDDDDDNNNNR
jgi:hypothetical protein